MRCALQAPRRHKEVKVCACAGIMLVNIRASQMMSMPTLTTLLRHLSPMHRVERRRRIYALADRWTDRLIDKYGRPPEALARCRRHQLSTTEHNAPFRNHLWSQIAKRLKERC